MDDNVSIRLELLRRELISTQQALAACEAELQRQQIARAAIDARSAAISEDLARKTGELSSIHRSRSWRLTGLLRALVTRARGLLNREQSVRFREKGLNVPPRPLRNESLSGDRGGVLEFANGQSRSSAPQVGKGVLLLCGSVDENGLRPGTKEQLRWLKQLADRLGLRPKLMLSSAGISLGELSAPDLHLPMADVDLNATIIDSSAVEKFFELFPDQIQAFVTIDAAIAIAMLPSLRLRHPDLPAIFAYQNTNGSSESQPSPVNLAAARAADAAIVQTPRERACLLASAPDVVVEILSNLEDDGAVVQRARKLFNV